MEELLAKMRDGIEAPLIRERIHKLIDDDRLSSPMTTRALQKEAEELLRLLQGGGCSEDSGD
ncbi:MAG: hypothetical protein V1857_04995 [archaeon]